MPYNTKGHHTWRVTNAGTAPLSLLVLERSCGCTTPNLSKEKATLVAAGSHYDVTLSWTAAKPDKMSATIKVGTNDPSRPEFTLAIAGKISPPVTAAHGAPAP
jgi:hypothetical protein